MTNNKTTEKYDDEIYSTNSIVCPYCKYEDMDLCDYEFTNEECIDTDCLSCNKKFTVSQEISYSYTSYKKKSNG